MIATETPIGSSLDPLVMRLELDEIWAALDAAEIDDHHGGGGESYYKYSHSYRVKEALCYKKLYEEECQMCDLFRGVVERLNAKHKRGKRKPHKRPKFSEGEPRTMKNTSDATEPFAEARGSDAPDCCAEWTRSGEALEPIAMLTSEYGVKLEKMRFKFCPWCGRVRPNDPSSATCAGDGR